MNYLKRYVDFLEKYLSIDTPIKAVFDCSNGTTGMILKEILNRENKLDAHLINDNPDGTFPAHDPGPLVEGAMDDLMETVPKQGADVGAIFDPDGDRVFFVDEKGERIDPREMFSLLAPAYKPPYVVNVALGKKPTEWIMPDTEIIEAKTGHYFMKEIMREKNVEFGIEHSGHYYFKDFFFADSSMIPALIMLSEVSRLKKEGKTLSEWRESNPKLYQTGELNFEIRDRNKVLSGIKNHFKDEAEKIGRASCRERV